MIVSPVLGIVLIFSGFYVCIRFLMHRGRYPEYCVDFVYKFGVNVIIVMLGNKIFC